MQISKILPIFCLSALLLPAFAFSQSGIYKWTDANGKVHYSTSALHKEAKSAALPSIQKEDIDARIKSIKQATPKNCDAHGGMDCSRGSDSDGSVICQDGFRKTDMPYKSHCVQTHLEVSYELQTEPLPAKIILNVRNLSAVKAKKVEVSYRLPKDSPPYVRFDTLELKGSSEIGPFGLENYSYSFSRKARIPRIQVFEKGKPIVKCKNCEGIRRARR